MVYNRKRDGPFVLGGRAVDFRNSYQIIDRFSEDIDILIEPPENGHVATGRNQDKPNHVRSRKEFYDWLAKAIHIKDITKVERDTAFDEKDAQSEKAKYFLVVGL